MFSKKLIALVLSVLLMILPGTSFAQSDSELFGLVAPSEGQSIPFGRRLSIQSDRFL